MKTTYIQPTITITRLEALQLICASGVQFGSGPADSSENLSPTRNHNHFIF